MGVRGANMARELNDIHTEIGNAYISQHEVKTAYNLTNEDVNKGYLNLFSKVAVSRLFFYAVAYCIYVFERILDAFKAETQTTVDAAFVANKAWWHTEIPKFQKGYNLVLNPQTFKYSYTTIDASAQIIKRRAVRETLTGGACKLQLLVATEGQNGIEALSLSDKSLFNIYADMIKPIGVLVEVVTGASDVVDVALTVNFNPLLLNTNGELLIDGSKPVEETIANYINNINNNNFGGNINITHLIDAIQQTVGVIDVRIAGLTITDENGNIKANNVTWGTYSSTNGWFSVGDLTGKITYQPQTDL